MKILQKLFLLTFVLCFSLQSKSAFSAYGTLPFSTGSDHNTLVETLIRNEAPRKALGFDAGDVSKKIVGLSHNYGLDPLLVLAIIKTESSFNPKAKSNVGAVGLMQVMPIVAKEAKRQNASLKTGNIWDPEQNVELGMYYYSKMLQSYKNDHRKALTAYNMGPTALNKRLRNKQAFSTKYYDKVMKYYSGLRLKSAIFKSVI